MHVDVPKVSFYEFPTSLRLSVILLMVDFSSWFFADCEKRNPDKQVKFESNLGKVIYKSSLYWNLFRGTVDA